MLLMDMGLLCLAFMLLWKVSNSSLSRDNALFLSLTLAAIIGRIIFAELPNIQPVSVLILIGGVYLGARRGVAMAILVTLSSNLYLGDGLWTLYQAAGWSMVAISGALLAKWLFDQHNKLSLSRVALITFIWGFVFDWWVSLSVLHSLNSSQFLLYLLQGIPYDLMHAFGNLTFSAWLVPITNSLLDKYKQPNLQNSSETSTPQSLLKMG